MQPLLQQAERSRRSLRVQFVSILRKMKALHTGRKTVKQVFNSHVSRKFFATDAGGIVGHPMHLFKECFPLQHQQLHVSQKNIGLINSFFENIVRFVGYRKNLSEMIHSSSNTMEKHNDEVRSVDMSSSGVYKHLLESMQGLCHNDNGCSSDDKNSLLWNNSIWQCSTMRKRKAKMNKHKLKKRRKRMRMNTKQTRN